MELIILYVFFMWAVSIMANICFVRILDEKKLSFSDFVNKELAAMIIMCVFAPIAFMILLFGVLAKIGIRLANAIPLEGKAIAKNDCSRCSYRCNNECLFFRLTLRPKMLCNGKFYNDLQYIADSTYSQKKVAN